MIFCDEENRVFYLESGGMTYACGVDGFGVLRHLHFGGTVGRDLTVWEAPSVGRSHSVLLDPENAGGPINAMAQELHTALGGDYNESGLEILRQNGVRRVDLRFEGVRVLPEKPALPGMPGVRCGETLEVTLADAGIRVRLLYSPVPGCAALVRRTVVENTGSEPLTLEKVYSAQFSLPAGAYDLLFLHGAHGREGEPRRLPLSEGLTVLGSRRGNSSAVINPYLSVPESGAGEESGRVWGLLPVYSGSVVLKAETVPAGLVRLSAGIDERDFSWELLPGEAFHTPEVILAWSGAGLGGLSRTLHRVLRDGVLPERYAKAPRPVVINNWEGTRFDFDEEKLHGIVDRAAGTGIDTFVLDDGWFGVRNDITSGLGDWTVNTGKLPHGLRGLADYVHGKGMKFGLWFEPEMVSPNSDLYRAHPDWAMEIPGVPGRLARRQLVLDLGREEVRRAVAEAVNAVLDEGIIDYVKWDCNRDLTEGYSRALPPHRQKECFHRYTLGLYDLLDRIVLTHPDVFFEGCCSGGGRFDAGMLFYFPQIWASDNTDAADRCGIQYGLGMAYPLSAHSCHISKAPNRYGEHPTPAESRAAVASLGAFGYETDLTQMDEAFLAAIPEQVRAFRADEDLVLNGDLYRLFFPFEGNLFGEELVAPDRSRAKIVLLRFRSAFNRPLPLIRPRGLSPDALYRCPELGRTARGDTWMERGFSAAFPEGDYRALTFHWERV